MSSPKVSEILSRIQAIHDRKNADYAQEGNPFSNFQRAAMLAEWFDTKNNKVFATLLGIKLARLAELLNGKEAKNESVDDSFLDLCTYCVIWMAMYQELPSQMTKAK